MNTKGLLSTIVGGLGVALALVPWVYIENPGWGTYLSTCAGAVFVGISRADSLAYLAEKRNPGDEFIRDTWKRIVNWWKRRFT